MSTIAPLSVLLVAVVGLVVMGLAIVRIVVLERRWEGRGRPGHQAEVLPPQAAGHPRAAA